jgi:hypothetical protein
MTAKDFYKISGYPVPSDKFDLLWKQFDQYDMIDFANRYAENIDFVEKLNSLKIKNQRKYVGTVMSLLMSLDFNGIDFEDYQLVLIRSEFERLKKISWLPMSVNFNIQKFE